MADGIKYRNDKQKAAILDDLVVAGMAEVDLAKMIDKGSVDYGKNGLLTENSRRQIKAVIKKVLGGKKPVKAKKKPKQQKRLILQFKTLKTPW
jgi:hypothetical protein